MTDANSQLTPAKPTEHTAVDNAASVRCRQGRRDALRGEATLARAICERTRRRRARVGSITGGFDARGPALAVRVACTNYSNQGQEEETHRGRRREKETDGRGVTARADSGGRRALTTCMNLD